MLAEIRSLGFAHAELSHGIRISLLPGIIEAVEAGEIKISSLHNYCPLPIGVNHAAPNLYLFSSENKRERENAWRHSLKTLEMAARFTEIFKALGFRYVTLDLEGYRQGSLNEVLNLKK